MLIFYQLYNNNLSTMPLPTFERHATTEPIGPRSIQHKCTQLVFYLLSIILPLHYIIIIHYSHLTLRLVRRGIDNPLAKLGASIYFICVWVSFILLACGLLLLRLNLGSSPRKILSATVLHHPFYSGKSNNSYRSSSHAAPTMPPPRQT